MLAADAVEGRHYLAGGHRLAVDRHHVASLEGERDPGRAVGGVLRRAGHPPHLLGGLHPRVLELVPLEGGVHEVCVHRVGGLVSALALDWNAVLRGVGEEALPRPEVPLSPRGDDSDPGAKGVGSELEPDLVVALAGRAVGDGVRPRLVRDLDQPLRDEGARDGGPEEVLPLVDRVRPEHREDEVTGELLPEVVDEDGRRTEELRLPARGPELLALSEIGGERHHLAAVVLLQPSEDDGGVEAAGVGEHDLVHVRHAGLRIASQGRAPGRRLARARFYQPPDHLSENEVANRADGALRRVGGRESIPRSRDTGPAAMFRSCQRRPGVSGTAAPAVAVS